MKRGRIPRKVKIGVHTWRVKTGKRQALKFKLETDESTVGYCERRTLRIGLDTSVPKQIVRESMMHEVLHAVFACCGMPLDDPMPTFDDDKMQPEEFVVKLMSPVLLGVLRDNPELVAFLLEGEHDEQRQRQG